jgi:hypothetical protein
MAAAPKKGAASKLRRGTISIIGSFQKLAGICLCNRNNADLRGSNGSDFLDAFLIWSKPVESLALRSVRA